MGEQQVLLELEQRPAKPREPVPIEQLQLRGPNRRQLIYAQIDIEQLVAAEDPVRAIWELSGKLDLSGFAAHLETRRQLAGRPAWDPRLLVAIWIWAYSQSISSAREIERKSRYRPELEWLCGMSVVNHHTLSDFRVFHAEALDNLLTQVLALLSQEGLVDLEQVAVDGTRIRAQASSCSQRRRPTLEKHLEQAREAVRQLSEEADDEGSNRRRQAARERKVRERTERMEQALEELPKVEAGKRTQEQRRQARVSEVEPEARQQHESNGGWGLGYNAQLATDAKEKIVVGVELTNNASDARQLTPTLDDVERRLEQKPKQVLADAGYATRANIEAMERDKIEYMTPAPAPDKGLKAALKAAGIGPGYEPKFFIYDEATDSFVCPAGRRLAYQRTSVKRERRYRQYQGKESDCRQC
jgi:transposase